MGAVKEFYLAEKDETEFGDGDGGGESEVMNISIDVVSNGYIVLVTYIDGDADAMVYEKKADALKALEEYM